MVRGKRVGDKISNLCHDRTKLGINDMNTTPDAATKIWYNLNYRIFHDVWRKVIEKLYLKVKYI